VGLCGDQRVATGDRPGALPPSDQLRRSYLAPITSGIVPESKQAQSSSAASYCAMYGLDNPRMDLDYIVVVDDDDELRRMVTGYLEEHNIPTKSASNKAELYRHFAKMHPSLIILDLRLGQDNGLDLLREIRSHSDVPVIVTTGHHIDEIDRVVGLELGADDYIGKPFSLRELLARIHAVLRRQNWGRIISARYPERGGYKFDGWRLDRRGRRLMDPNEKPVRLSKSEYALLLAFLGAPQRPLTREHLLQATRIHEDVFDRSIDVQVLRLRRKLEINPGVPRMIQTVRGVGYVFALSVEPF
jgi:two-component system OmpR family response regulator